MREEERCPCTEKVTSLFHRHEAGRTPRRGLAFSHCHWCGTNCFWPLTWSHLLRKIEQFWAHLCEIWTSCLWQDDLGVELRNLLCYCSLENVKIPKQQDFSFLFYLTL